MNVFEKMRQFFGKNLFNLSAPSLFNMKSAPEKRHVSKMPS